MVFIYIMYAIYKYLYIHKDIYIYIYIYTLCNSYEQFDRRQLDNHLSILRNLGTSLVLICELIFWLLYWLLLCTTESKS